MGQKGTKQEGGTVKEEKGDEGEDVEVDEMLVSNPKNFGSVALFKKKKGKDDSPASAREDLPIPNARCFLLRNLLSEKECKHYIAESEKVGYSDLKGEFMEEYRNNDRVLVLSEELANVLWERIEPALTRRDVIRVRPMCFGNGGTWRPIRLNECFKFGKYSPSCHFSPHIDGPWVPRDDESSIYTVVIYLNSDFDGGATNFLHEDGKEKGKVLCKVVPETGMALVFNHDVYHEGEPIATGTKYIMRTEIMFRRIDSENLVDPMGFGNTEAYQRTLKLYRKSYKLQKKGDVQGFTDTYLQAIRLQRAEQASVAKDADEIFQQDLPVELYIYVFSYLSDAELARLLLVNKTWYDMVLDGALWKGRYLARWGNETVENTLKDSSKKTIVSGVTQDWFGQYWNRVKMEGGDKSVIVIDLGGHSVKAAMLDKLSHSHKVCHVESIVAKVPGLFDLHVRRYKWTRYYSGKEAREQPDTAQYAYRVIKDGDIIDSATLPELFAGLFTQLEVFPKVHPVLIAEPVRGWEPIQKEAIENILFKLFRVPLLGFMNAATLALCRHNMNTGVVLSIGQDTAFIAAVWKGEVFKDHVVTVELTDPRLEDNKKKTTKGKDDDGSDTRIRKIKNECTYNHSQTLKRGKAWEEKIAATDWGALLCQVVGKASNGNTALQKDLFQHILVTGGKTLMKGFEDKLRKSLCDQFCLKKKKKSSKYFRLMTTDIKEETAVTVDTPESRIFDVAVGGSMAVSSPSLKSMGGTSNIPDTMNSQPDGCYGWGCSQYYESYMPGFREGWL